MGDFSDHGAGPKLVKEESKEGKFGKKLQHSSDRAKTNKESSSQNRL